MNFLITILASMFLSFSLQECKISFNIEPKSITIGDSATLNWYVTGVDQVFISNIGKVDFPTSLHCRKYKTQKYAAFRTRRTSWQRLRKLPNPVEEKSILALCLTTSRGRMQLSAYIRNKLFRT